MTPNVQHFGALAFLSHFTNSPVMVIVMAGIAVYAFYQFVFRSLGKLLTMVAVAVLAVAGVITFQLHHAIAGWQKAVLRKPVVPHHSTSGSLTPSSMLSSVGTPNYAAMSPLSHENAWLIAALVVLAVLWVLAWMVYRAMSPAKRAEWVRKFASSAHSSGKSNGKMDAEFPINEVELAVEKENGQRLVISGKDRFLNTLILGAIGTGKTSRILLKAIYQDLRAMANGWFHDVIVLDPDGEFAQKVVEFAERELHIKDIQIIDLAGKLPSTHSFNPFLGGNIADIVDNVRAALQEQMGGEQDAFFQNAQDDLVRTVIMIQVSLWPETDFLQFADLVTDPFHFRAICNMVSEVGTGQSIKQVSKNKNKDEQAVNPELEYEGERQAVKERFDLLNKNDRSMVLTAARSFLRDTNTETKMEKLESITKGLKIVVGELANNPRLRKVFGTSELNAFDFKSFLATQKERPGRLVVVTTGNRPAGLLFGKLFLVTLKMYSLEREGKEDTRRPVYLYVDEFPVFGTESFTQMFSQARKYRVGMMFAMQARSQLDDVSKKFLDVVEGNSRNKVFFGSPSPEDAKFLEKALGAVTKIKTTHRENKLMWFGLADSRNLDRSISTTEMDEARFRLEDIMYGLSAEEAIFSITVNNEAQKPTIGITSYADQWVHEQRGFFDVSTLKEEKSRARTKRIVPTGKGERAEADNTLATVPDPNQSMKDHVANTYRLLTQEDVSNPIPPIHTPSTKPPMSAKKSEVISLANLTNKTNSVSTVINEQVEEQVNVRVDDEATVSMTPQATTMKEDQSDSMIVSEPERKENREVQAERLDLTKPRVSKVSQDAEEPLCEICQRPMAMVKWDVKETYEKKVYQCAGSEIHEEKIEQIKITCRQCGSEVSIQKNNFESLLICPKCGVVGRRTIKKRRSAK